MPEPLPYATLTVLGGALKGTQLVIDDAVDDVLIGSDPDCRLYLDVPGVSPIHARLWLDADGAVLHDTRSPAGVWVNDDRVDGKLNLKDGDIVWLGQPGEAHSVMIQFRAFTGEGAADAPPPVSTPMSAAPHSASVAVPPAEWVIEEEASVAEPVADYAQAGESLLEGVLDEPVEPARAVPAPVPDELETNTFEPAPDAFEPGPALAQEQYVRTDEPQSAAFDDDAIVIDEPPPPAATYEPPPVVPPPPRAAAPAEEFFIEEPETPAAAPPAFAAAPEPAPADVLFDEPAAAVFDEPAFESPAPAPAPAAEVEEEFFFDVPAAPSVPAPAPDTFFIEEPADAAAAPAMAAPPAPAPEADWSAASEPFDLPSEPAPPPPPPAAPKVEPPAPVAAPAPAPVVVEKATAPPGPEPAPRARRPAGARPGAGARPAARPAAAASGGGAMKWVLIAVGALALLGAGVFFALRPGKSPSIAAVEPARARAGERIAITGEHFAAEAADNAVSFGGRAAGKVLSASPTRLEVEVPALTVTGEGKVAVVVTAGGKASPAFELAVFKAPRVHGISPSVAMPGEEVTLAGVDWGPGAIVKFGDLPAAVLETTPTSIRVRVPDVTDPVGTSLPVVVSMGGDPSNQAPFVIGKIPLVTSVDPAGVSAGDVVTVKGRGFPLQPAMNDLKIGGVGALVISALDNELKAIVPWAPTGEAPLELRVPRSENVGTASMTLAPRPDPVEFRFVAGPIRDDPGHDHAVLATALGPAFVLSASGGRSAAERAFDAQQKLAEAAVALKASLTADFEVRDLEGSPAIGLTGRPEPLFEVTAEDAAAYNEDWTGLKGKGGPVTRARLALWWGAVARDLVLLLIRGEKPHFAAELAPEGRVLGQVGDAAKKTGKFGLPLEVVEKAPAGWREPLRVLALRVPVAVKGPASAAGETPAAEAAPGGPLKLDGIWSGSEVEGGTRKYVTVTFTSDGGTLTYERALTMSVPIENVRAQKAAVQFSAKSGSRIAWYVGKWDGVKVRGTVHADTATGVETGTFELERKR